MSENMEKLLEELLAEQKRTSLYTLTLDRARLFGSLLQTGLLLPVLTANEFSLPAGATATIVQAVPRGFVFLMAGPGVWYTSLPWWCSYSMWLDTTAPALPLWGATRMPEALETPDFSGLLSIRGFLLHQVTNNHVANHAYGMVQNTFAVATTETWDMIKAVYVDPIVADVRRKALEISGVQR